MNWLSWLNWSATADLRFASIEFVELVELGLMRCIRLCDLTIYEDGPHVDVIKPFDDT